MNKDNYCSTYSLSFVNTGGCIHYTCRYHQHVTYILYYKFLFINGQDFLDIQYQSLNIFHIISFLAHLESESSHGPPIHLRVKYLSYIHCFFAVSFGSISVHLRCLWTACPCFNFFDVKLDFPVKCCIFSFSQNKVMAFPIRRVQRILFGGCVRYYSETKSVSAVVK